MNENNMEQGLQFKVGDEVMAWDNDDRPVPPLSDWEIVTITKIDQNDSDMPYRVRRDGAINASMPRWWWCRQDEVKPLPKKEGETTTNFKTGDRVKAIRWVDSNKGNMIWKHGTVKRANIGHSMCNIEFDNNIHAYNEWCCDHKYVLALHESIPEGHQEEVSEKPIELEGEKEMNYNSPYPHGPSPNFCACSGIITHNNVYHEGFAKQSPKPERSEGLIPNPCPTGRYYLPGTGHHFDRNGYMRIYYDKNHNVINIDPWDEHQTALFKGYWTYSHLPTNLNTSGMNEESLDLIQKMIIRRDYIKVPQYQNELRERRRKIWRSIKKYALIGALGGILFGATIDYKHGCKPRNWVKGLLTTVGQQLQNVGQNVTKQV